MPAAVAPVPVVAAEGNLLPLADGRRLVEAMSSWWAAIHRYRHPVLDARHPPAARRHVAELERLLVEQDDEIAAVVPSPSLSSGPIRP